MVQLTLRSVIMGSCLGAFMSLSNLYVGLKTGWGLGVAITSCILSFTIWKSLRKVAPKLFRTDFTILENNAMQSTASSAGYSTGGTIVSAISAYLIVNGQHIPYGLLSAWVFFLAVLGVSMAIPMKRQMINIERLRFPSGIAAAETLRNLHAGKTEEGAGAAKALFGWGGFGMLLAILRDWMGWLPQLFNVFGARMGMYTVSFEASGLLVGAGAIMGFRVAVSLLIGGILNWAILAPMMIQHKVIEHPPPTIRTLEKLQFPFTMPAGSALNFHLIEANKGITIAEGADTLRLSYVWNEATTYAGMSALLTALNDSLLPDRQVLNPFSGHLVFGEPLEAYRKGMLEVKAVKAIHYEASLALADTGSRLDLAWAAGQLLNVKENPAAQITLEPALPLEIPAGFTLPIILSQGDERQLYTYTWREVTSYADVTALRNDLQAPLTKSGDPNPLAGAFLSLTSENTLYLAPRSAAALLTFNPAALDDEEPGGYRNIVSWSLWGGAACMVTSALLSFALQWRTALRAFSGLQRIFRRRKKVAVQDPLEQVEVPGWWFAAGMTAGTIGILYLAYTYFHIPVWMGLLAVVLSFFLGLVACRSCGETDTTPVGAMGKITQLTFGAIAPRQMNLNLMTACITAGVADSASDLLTDLKSGYVLGANARKQFLAQFSGIFIGTAIAVPAFYLVVPDVSVLGSTKFPAPAAQVWASVALLLSNGFESLHPTARWALVIGGSLGLLLTMVEAIFPKARKYLPSTMGLGLAFVIPFYNVFSMFLGGLIAEMITRSNPEKGEKYIIPSASGLIAGESLMGIFITLLGALGWIG